MTRIFFPSPAKPNGLCSRAVALLLALLLAFAPMRPALAQASNLPRLGDAAADELSPAFERRLGEQIMHEIRRDPDYADDPEANAWLNGFAASLTQTSAAAGHALQLFMMRDRSLNAFALPGGYIGVHSGLIVAAQSESELASVIAHEIGHVTQRHIARMLARERQTSVVMLAAMVLAALAATSSPQAAAGVASLGGTIATQQMLGFSRDAEREADRLGLDMLRDAGFDVNGMVSLLGRLQSSNRLHDTAAPEYLRTHPVTADRIADIQSRLRDERYRQRPDSLEFRLLQTRLRATADPGVDGLARAAATFERQRRDGSMDEGLASYGLAAVRHAQRRYADADAALAQARRSLGDHVFLDRLAAQVALDAGDPARAIAIANRPHTRDVDTTALQRIKARALIARGDGKAAAREIERALELRRSDPELWRLLAEAWNLAGEPGRAYMASAEQFALIGGLPAAIDQLRRARQAGTLDFYSASRADARQRELQALYRQEQEDRKAMKR